MAAVMGGPGRGGPEAVHEPSANGQSSSAAGNNGGGAKKDENFDPAVLNNIATWLRSLRLHKYTPNFEGMSWKEMVLMDEQALEAQGVADLGTRRKMLKTFELSGGKWASTRLRHRHHRRPLCAPAVVGVYPWFEQS